MNPGWRSSRVRAAPRAAILVLFGAALAQGLASCNLFEPAPDPPVVTHPSKHNQVIRAGEPISVRFRFSVDRTAAAELVRVSTVTGTVSGSSSWNGRTLEFVPHLPLQPRTPYRLEVEGTIPDGNGRPHRVSAHVRFFYESAAGSGLYLELVDPQPGTTIATGSRIQLGFSHAVDEESFRAAFDLTPSTPYDIEWNPQGTVAVIRPEEPWEHFRTYRFTISDRVATTDGQRAVRAWELAYHVAEDDSSPEVVDITPALRSWEQRFPSTLPASGSAAGEWFTVAFDDAIRVEFSKPMDRTRTETAVRLTPARAVRREWVDDNVLVLIPQPDWEPSVEYMLRVEPSAADTLGNRLAGGRTVVFERAAQELTVLEVQGEPHDEQFPIGPVYSEHLAAALSVGHHPHEYRFRIRFSQPFLDEATRQNAQDLVRVQALFPPGSGSPARIGSTWSSDTELSVSYSGFTPGTDGDPRYYLLIIPASIRSSIGGSLELDLRQLLRSVSR